MPLSDLEVKRAKPREKPYSMSDEGGLYLWVTPPGGKSWRWGYTYDRKEKLMTFGRYPDVPLALARSRHLDARRQLANGVDPMALRKAEKKIHLVEKGDSFAAVTKCWIDHWSEGKSLRHVDYVRRRLEADILPGLGMRSINEIVAQDLVSMVKAIEARGARDIAKRALETTGQIFRFGIAHGYATRNPASDIRPSDVLRSSKRVNHAHISEKELPQFLRCLDIYPGTHLTRFAIKLLMLTFVRTRELIEATWPEIDLKNARWDLPAGRMKMRSPHIVPISRQAAASFEMLKSLSGPSDWVFPGVRDSNKPMSNNTVLKGLERMGYKGTMTGHGFRGLASTILHERGYEHEHIELQLAHAPRNAVSAAYNHALHLKARAKMMQEWADYLDLRRESAVGTSTSL